MNDNRTSPLHGRSQLYPENKQVAFALIFHVSQTDPAQALKFKYLHGHPKDAQCGN